MDAERGRLMNRRSLIVAAFGLVACQPVEEGRPLALDGPEESRLPVVYTVNYPLAWMAERVGGDSVAVVLPVRAGVDPAHWQPSPETVLDYQGADLVLLNGAGYAGWVQFASLSPGRLVDTARGLEDRLVPAGETTHTHGPAGEHDHADVASHTWLDPTLAAEQARAVAAAFTALRPEGDADFEARLKDVQAELGRLDERSRETFNGWQGAGVLYSHPVYQYLDARYELGGWNVIWEPGEDPGEAEWQRLARRLSDKPAGVMLWEGEPLPAVAERLRRMGVEPVVFETGAIRPATGDYVALMNRNLERAAGLALNRKDEDD